MLLEALWCIILSKMLWNKYSSRLWISWICSKLVSKSGPFPGFWPKGGVVRPPRPPPGYGPGHFFIFWQSMQDSERRTYKAHLLSSLSHGAHQNTMLITTSHNALIKIWYNYQSQIVCEQISVWSVKLMVNALEQFNFIFKKGLSSWSFIVTWYNMRHGVAVFCAAIYWGHHKYNTHQTILSKAIMIICRVR